MSDKKNDKEDDKKNDMGNNKGDNKKDDKKDEKIESPYNKLMPNLKYEVEIKTDSTKNDFTDNNKIQKLSGKYNFLLENRNLYELSLTTSENKYCNDVVIPFPLLFATYILIEFNCEFVGAS